MLSVCAKRQTGTKRPNIGQLIKNSSNFDEVVKTDNGLLADGIDASLLPVDEK